jgi:hypothetical protein
VTACEPGREFGFEVLLGDRPVNDWHHRFVPAGGGRRNVRDMRKTLERIKAVVEA